MTLVAGLSVGVSPYVAPLLLSARTVYVNSATGNDATGDGSAVAPWQTLARAWVDRLSYGELRAVYTLNLLGVGPYTMPVLGPSVCGVGGYFVLRGDPSADTVAISGTFTGDLSTSTYVVGTSAGLGADTHKGKFLHITSGNCSGVRCLIVANTDTTITVALTDYRTVLGAIVNGDTFEIHVPGTTITCAVPTPGQPSAGATDWVGGSYPNGTALGTDAPQRHMITDVLFAGSGQVHFKNCAVLFAGVKHTNQFHLVACRVSLGLLIDGAVLGVGADSKTDKLTGYGLTGTGTLLVGAVSHVFGVVYASGTLTLGSSSIGDEFIFNGGRFDGAVNVNGGRLENFGGSSFMQVAKTITVFQNGQLIMNGGKWLFALTVGTCLVVKSGSLAILNIAGGVTISGGTTDAAGYGMQALSGAKILVLGGAPMLTGGTAGADIKVENVAVAANSVLAANGQAVTDAITLTRVMRVAA